MWLCRLASISQTIAVAILGCLCDNLTENLTVNQKTKLSTKGQVVLPKSLRIKRRWKPGTEFLVQEHGDGVLLTPKSVVSSGTWSALFGCVPYRGARKTIQEMNQAVAAEARSHK
jgi:AbrB family looped-hinge helix DNA binding protein